MSEHPVFHFRSTKEKPKTFIELKLKNNNIEFICNTELDVKINDKLYILDTKIAIKCELNNEPEITVNCNVINQEQMKFNINDLLFIMNDFKNKVENDIKNVENINDDKLKILEEQERKFMEIEEKHERLRLEEEERLRLEEEERLRLEEEERLRLEEEERLRLEEEERLRLEEEERLRLEEEERLRLEEEERLRLEEEERLSLEKKEKERLIPKNKVITQEIIVQNLKKDLEGIKNKKINDKVDNNVDNTLKIQLNILEHIKLLISDNPNMIYTNLIYIITELMKYVETINTEDFDKKSLIIKSIKMFLEYQNLSSPETDMILETVCPELIDILLLVDKRKIVIKKKMNCFLPWCA